MRQRVLYGHVQQDPELERAEGPRQSELRQGAPISVDPDPVGLKYSATSKGSKVLIWLAPLTMGGFISSAPTASCTGFRSKLWPDLV